MTGRPQDGTGPASSSWRRCSRAVAATGARLRHSVRTELAPLSRPSAFSWRVGIVFVVIAAITQWVADAEHTGVSPAPWLSPTVVGVVAFLVVFALMRRVVAHRRLAPGQVLAVFALAGTARSLAVGATAVALDLSDSIEYWYRLAGGLMLSPALLGVLASAVVRHDAHHEVVTELQGQRDRLLDLGRSLDEALARTEDEITIAVRAAIQPALHALDSVLDQVIADASTRPAVDALARLVDDEVRPISHRLAESDRWTSVSIDRAHHPRRVRVPLPSTVAIADGIRPVIAALLFVSVSGPTVLRLADLGIAVVRLSEAFVVVWTVLTLVRRVLRRVQSPPVVAVVANSAVHVAAALVIVPALVDPWLPLGAGGRIVGLPVAGVVGALTTIAVLVDARRAATQDELVRVVDELGVVVDMIGRRARLASTRLAHVVHGSLQGALHAAAIRLAEAHRPDAALVQTIRHDIAAALSRIDDRDAGRAELQDTLDELIGVWSGHRTISVTVAPDVAEVLTHDRDADTATAEVVREAVNNALRHGHATSVTIDIRRNDTPSSTSIGRRQSITIEVTDDGSGWPHDAERGLGTILFDDLCTTWQHTEWHHAHTGQGTRFTAVVGVDVRTSDDGARTH